MITRTGPEKKKKKKMKKMGGKNDNVIKNVLLKDG